jgi:hypothetical protein
VRDGNGGEPFFGEVVALLCGVTSCGGPPTGHGPTQT